MSVHWCCGVNCNISRTPRSIDLIDTSADFRRENSAYSPRVIMTPRKSAARRSSSCSWSSECASEINRRARTFWSAAVYHHSRDLHITFDGTIRRCSLSTLWTWTRRHGTSRTKSLRVSSLLWKSRIRVISSSLVDEIAKSPVDTLMCITRFIA